MQCERLFRLLEGKVGLAVLYGAVGKRAISSTVAAVESGGVQVLLATASLVGEGWDCPRLSAVFLASPVGRGPRLRQLVGRVMRPTADKPSPVVYDYKDSQVQLLAHMARNRDQDLRRLLGPTRVPSDGNDASPTRRATILPIAPEEPRREVRPRAQKPTRTEITGQLWLPFE